MYASGRLFCSGGAFNAVRILVTLTAVGFADIVLVSAQEQAKEGIKSSIEAYCDQCNADVQSDSKRGLIVICDFQPGPIDPCPIGKQSIASVQQWALFDLLDLVQSDIYFSAVFVLERPYTLRSFAPVPMLERSELRRRIIQAAPRAGGSLQEGLTKAFELLASFKSTADHPKQLSLVLLLTRPVPSPEALATELAKFKEIDSALQLHVVSTVASQATRDQHQAFAELVQANYGPADSHRELSAALNACFKQLGAFDASYAEELKVVKATLAKCCHDKQELCKLVDQKTPGYVQPVDLSVVINELKVLQEKCELLNNRLNDLEISIVNKVSSVFVEQIGDVKKQLSILMQEIKTIESSIGEVKTLIQTSTANIIAEIKNIKIASGHDPKATADEIMNRLRKWIYLLMLMLLIALGGIAFLLIKPKRHRGGGDKDKDEGRYPTEPTDLGGSYVPQDLNEPKSIKVPKPRY